MSRVDEAPPIVEGHGRTEQLNWRFPVVRNARLHLLSLLTDVHVNREFVAEHLRAALQQLRQALRGHRAQRVRRYSARRNLQRAQQLRKLFRSVVHESCLGLERGFAGATTFYAFPKRHWKKIRTTNGIERLHGEIKRRTKAVGAFPDRASALRLITAVALQVTTKWSDRRYVDLSLLENKELNQAA